MKNIKTSLGFLTIVLFYLFTTMFLDSCNSENKYPGYKLIEKKFIKEVNADCYLLEHVKSGARILKIASDDPNKTFCITFRTIPDSDYGTPHILEHSVLNGSENYPVKSPFDVLSKGSLNTFLNAFTGSDLTGYPVASMNEKDYFNLMHVYLDAVFNPLIYSDERIFMQEGWHYELKSKDAPLEYNGVVYNEMKGAYSDPERILYDQTMKNLFPDNSYRFSAGGMPQAIPDLTYKKFLEFHRKYYHPSNSYIFLYGNADLGKELDFIDKNYLSHYEKQPVDSGFKENPPFSALKDITAYYPVIEGSSTSDQTYLSLNWVTGTGYDDLTNLELDVLADVLVNQESAPVRIALRDAGIGKDVSASSTSLFQNFFTVKVVNANPQDKEKFRTTVMDALRKVSEGKIDRDALRGTINRTEFRLREGDDAQKGLLYWMRCISKWMYTGDPFSSLEYENYLDKLKKSVDGTDLENLIKNDFLENNYSLLLSLEPEPGLEKENIQRLANQLSDYKKSLSSSEIDSLVDTTQKLKAYQESEDTPEALATIPMLKISDINKKATWYGCTEEDIEGIPVLFHNEFTNNILYTTQWFDLRALPQDLIPYAALLSDMLGKLGTEKFDYKQLDKELKINTGDFNSFISVRVPGNDDSKMAPMLTITMKTTPDKIDTSFILIGEIVKGTDFTDKERLKELLIRDQSNLESSLKQDGFTAALKRFESYLSNRGMIVELTSNIDYYRFINGLINQFNNNPDDIIAKLKEVADLVFNQKGMSAAITCGESDFDNFSSSFRKYINGIKSSDFEIQTWNLNPQELDEGIMTPSKVQYVIEGFDYRKLNLQREGKWKVLQQILSTDWLQTQIRVIGGAYGGFAIFRENGSIILASYRDPNLSQTLERYDKTVDFLRNFQADSSSMTRFIIGTIANLDNLTTPSGHGEISYNNYFLNKTPESIQKERDEVLSTTPEDIREMSDFISEIIGKHVLCVYGNDGVIKSNKSLFKNLITIDK
jgi:Zn-dependent M16 (insulinase) family peptidase